MAGTGPPPINHIGSSIQVALATADMQHQETLPPIGGPNDRPTADPEQGLSARTSPASGPPPSPPLKPAMFPTQGSMPRGSGSGALRSAGTISVEKLTKMALARGGIAQRFVGMLEDQIDQNSDGQVDANELLNCMEMLVEEQKMRRMFTGFMIASFIITVVTVAAITGLSVLVGEKLKDTKVTGEVMVVKATQVPVQVASSDMTVVNGSLVSRSSLHGNSTGSGQVQVSTKLTEKETCPLMMNNDELVHLTIFSLRLTSGLDFFIKVDGYVRSYTPPAIVVYTPLGELHIKNLCTELSGSAIEFLQSKNYIPATDGAGRHLLQYSSSVIKTYSSTSGGTSKTGGGTITPYYG